MGRHEDILERAAEVFNELGYRGASVQEVARRVGLLKGSLPGFLLVMGTLWKVYKKCAILASVGSVRLTVTAALVAGVYLQVGVFQQYGFTTLSGFLITPLTIRRLYSLGSSMGPEAVPAPVPDLAPAPPLIVPETPAPRSVTG